MEQNLLEIVAPSGNVSLQLTIPGLDDWEISVQGTIFGIMMGLLFLIVALAGVIVILWTAYSVFFKLIFLYRNGAVGDVYHIGDTRHEP